MSKVPENVKMAILDGQYDYELTAPMQVELTVYLIEALEEQTKVQERIADSLALIAERVE